MARNKYKVTKKLWKTFKTEQAKKLYNSIMDTSLKNQMNMNHPKQVKLPSAQWRTLCHNFACTAAWALRDAHPVKGSDVHLLTSRGKVVKTSKMK